MKLKANKASKVCRFFRHGVVGALPSYADDFNVTRPFCGRYTRNDYAAEHGFMFDTTKGKSIAFKLPIKKYLKAL